LVWPNFVVMLHAWVSAFVSAFRNGRVSHNRLRWKCTAFFTHCLAHTLPPVPVNPHLQHTRAWLHASFLFSMHNFVTVPVSRGGSQDRSLNGVSDCCIGQCMCSSLVFVLHFLILNLTVMTNFITVPLCDCEIHCFNDQCMQSILEGQVVNSICHYSKVNLILSLHW